MKTKPSFLIFLALAASTSLVWAEPKLQVSVQAANPALLAGKKQTTYIKVGLTGFARESEADRSPVNIALVLDRSGSMSGPKIDYAKEAARMAVTMLRPDDIFSLITYESTVEVVVPSTKIANGEEIIKAIDAIEADGNTALFGGVAKGAAEVRKFLSREHVNSVILVSDGLANVGPSSPRELGALGKSLIKEGISVTTLGLGLDYNEDLMVKLAEKSDGGHRFIQEPQQIVNFFKEEFGNVMNVVAQKVDIIIECHPDIRPLRVIGREAEIAGQTVRLPLNQIYSKEEKYVLLEVEVPVGLAGESMPLASVSVSYDNLSTAVRDQQSGGVGCRYVASQAEVDQAVNRDVLLGAVTQIATEANREALILRDQGKVQRAKSLLESNVDYLKVQAPLFEGNRRYRALKLSNEKDRDQIENDANWSVQRKRMRVGQNFFNGAQNGLPVELQEIPEPDEPNSK